MIKFTITKLAEWLAKQFVPFQRPKMTQNEVFLEHLYKKVMSQLSRIKLSLSREEWVMKFSMIY